MNQIVYKIGTDDLKNSIEKLDDLGESVGWGRRKYHVWEKILTKSSFVITAWQDDRAVGFGRVLEDGVMCMIYDVMVHPDFQNQKIGSHIMRYILSEIKKQDFASIGLFAWDKNPLTIPFYKKFGFRPVNFGMKLLYNK